ncbi:MAG: lysophospholipase [Thermodesulfobacteriota bacterium]
MKHTEGEFTAFNNWQLYYQAWQPDVAPKAALIIVHGVGEHSGRYMNLISPLLAKGYAVYSFDHRGHGRSPEGLAAHVNDWREYRQDLKLFVDFVRGQQELRPLFLLGHSMGGLITANYVLHYPQGLQGVVLSSPPLGDIGVSPVLRFLGRLLALIKPDFALGNGLDVNAISRDPEAVRQYLSDPLVHDRVTAQWSVEFFQAIDWTQAQAADFKPPLLIIHGDADAMVPCQASRSFFDQVGQVDKSYIAYPGGFHENFNDLHQQQAAADVGAWLDQHLTS